MGSLCKCPNCGNFYTDSDEFMRAIAEGVKKDSYYLAKVKCSNCGALSVQGGEADFDFETGQSAILMIGFGYDAKKHAELPEFESIALHECDKSSAEFSTVACVDDDFRKTRNVYLRRGNNGEKVIEGDE